MYERVKDGEKVRNTGSWGRLCVLAMQINLLREWFDIMVIGHLVLRLNLFRYLLWLFLFLFFFNFDCHVMGHFECDILLLQNGTLLQHILDCINFRYFGLSWNLDLLSVYNILYLISTFFFIAGASILCIASRRWRDAAQLCCVSWTHCNFTPIHA